MQVLRRTLLSVCSAVLGLSLIGLAWSHSLSATLRNQDVVKSWLAESGFYDELGAGVVNQVAENSGGEAAAIIQNEEIQQVATNALGATNVLQESVEQLLNSVYTWLDGGELPATLNVDFSDASQKLSDGLGNYAATRAAGLPVCSPQQAMMLQASYDVWSAPCRPAQLSSSQVGETARQEILSSIGGGSTDLSTSDIVTQENQENLEKVRSAYQRSRWMPYVFALLAILSGAGLVFASSERRKGVNRAGWLVIGSGIVVGLSAFFISRGPAALSSALKNTNQEQSAAEIIIRLLETAGHDIARILWRYGALYIALGLIATVVATKVMKRSQPGSMAPSRGGTSNGSATIPANSNPASTTPASSPSEKQPVKRPQKKIQF